MASIHDQVSEHFYKWEKRGRGGLIAQTPVHLEPRFIPFQGHLPKVQIIDDGRKPTFLSRAVQGLANKFSTKKAPEETEEQIPTDPFPLERTDLVEFVVSIPRDHKLKILSLAPLLSAVQFTQEPISFEVFAFGENIEIQFVAHPEDGEIIQRRIQTHESELTLHPRENGLTDAWTSIEPSSAALVEFGLAKEFFLPLRTDGNSILIDLLGAMDQVQDGEVAVYQVLFEGAKNPWSESIVESITGSDGKMMFSNVPEMGSFAEKKCATPFFGVVLRIAVLSEHGDRAWRLTQAMAHALTGLSNGNGNELFPLSNEEYPFEQHYEDVLMRQSRRCGMILNLEELLQLVHFPSPDIRIEKQFRRTKRSKAVPKALDVPDGVLLGLNEHGGKSVPVRLTSEQRVRHMHVVGTSGTGKSTLLFNLINQDIQNGAGVAVLDPHGGLVERILAEIPTERIKDVVLIDPGDPEYSVGFNILTAYSEAEKSVLASDLVSVFQRLSTSWGDQMDSVLSYAIMAFLENPEGGSILELRRFLMEPAFRDAYIKGVRDPETLYYWEKGFPMLVGNKSIGPILTRLGNFLRPKPIHDMVSQKENKLDFSEILNSGKIFLAKLSQGIIGRDNSYLLGSLMMAKFHQAAMGRENIPESQRKDFWLYVDEFHNFMTPSVAEILAETRKYRLGLILAHHELNQLTKDSTVASAVMTHPHVRVCFQVSSQDAKLLAPSFSYFEPDDFQNLDKGEAICRIEKNQFDFNIRVPWPEPIDPVAGRRRRDEVVASSRAKYGLKISSLTPAAAPKEASPKPTSPEATAASKPVSAVGKELNETSGKPKAAPAPVEPIVQDPVAKAIEELEKDPEQGQKKHEEIKVRLKKIAEDWDFIAEIEKIVDGPEKKGRIDLALKRGKLLVACEVMVSRHDEYEIGNIRKCFFAGYPLVVMISPFQARLAAIRKRVESQFTKEEAGRISYFQPKRFVKRLQEWAEEDPEGGAEGKSRPKNTDFESFANLDAEELKRQTEIEVEKMRKMMEGQKPPPI